MAAYMVSSSYLGPLRQPFHIYGTDGAEFIDLSGQDPGAGWVFSLHLGNGDDFAYGSEFGDYIYGEGGHDFLSGKGGNDFLFGGEGYDDLRGGEGNDFLNGGADNDFLFGDNGADTLKGGSGSDSLNGGAGNDVLDGGLVADSLVGGAGADRFVLTDKNATDVIFDFSAVEGDKIDIAALLDSATNFAGTTAMQAYTQGYVYFVQYAIQGTSNIGTMVYIDPNGGAHGAQDYCVAKLLDVEAAELTSLPLIV